MHCTMDRPIQSTYRRAGGSAAHQSKRIGERRGSPSIPLVNLNEWLKLRHALTPSRRRGPDPTALTGRTALQDGWHGDAPAAIRHPQVERARFLFWASDSVAERTVSIVRSTKLTTTTPRIRTIQHSAKSM